MVYGRLAAAAGVAALVGTRIYPDTPVQSPTRPYITYHEVGEERSGAFGTRDTLPGVRIQVDCWAETRAGAKALDAAVRSALDAQTWSTGGSGDEAVRACIREGGLGSVYESDTKLYRASHDYVLWYAEAA